MSERNYINSHLIRMEVGQRINFSSDVFEKAFPCGWPSIYRTHEQAFLSAQMGSAFGAWTCEKSLTDGSYRVGKHEEGKKRVYVDPDREHYFKKNDDGTLTRIDLHTGK